MKVTTFILNKPESRRVKDGLNRHGILVYKVPVLPAYAYLNAKIDFLLNSSDNGNGFSTSIVELKGDEVVIDHNLILIGYQPEAILTLYHHGIKDYSLLFPQVVEQALKERLGHFAKEADKAFESEAWLSYCLMVGGVLEGVLYEKLGKKNFSPLIREACKQGLVTPDESKLIESIKNYRNMIHANRYEESMVSRSQALDLSVIYDRLLKRNWE